MLALLKTVPLKVWGIIAVALVVAGLGAALKVQTARLASCQAEHRAFVAEQKALGERQAAEAKVKDAFNIARKANADAETNRIAAERDALARRLRDASPRPIQLPEAAPGSVRPDLACLDRAESDRADGELVEGLRGLAAKGTKAVDELNVAKRWAQNGDR